MEQLNEIITRCPEERQTMLLRDDVQATYPVYTLDYGVEPQLVRLDTDTKMSDELRMAFFTVR